VFFSYSSSHLGYRCLDIASHRIYISRHVRFYEHVFPFDNSEQIAKVLNTTTTQPATVTFLTLLHYPTIPILNSHENSALPLQTTTIPQPPPLLCSSSHTCLSNHYNAGLARQLISSPPGLGAISSPSSVSPFLASVTADSASAYNPSSANSLICATDSSSSSPAGLKLMVDLSSYQLLQISLPCHHLPLCLHQRSAGIL